MFRSHRARARAPIVLSATVALLLTSIGCQTGGGSSTSRTDRGGDAPASDSVIGRRDGGTDRVRPARGTIDRNTADATAPAAGLVRTSLAYPTGDRQTSLVMLEVDAPEQVRVGQAYNYTLRVTNLTDTPLHDVAVRDMSTAIPADPRGAAATGALGAHQHGDAGAGDRPSAAHREDRETDRQQARRAAAAAWNVGTLAPKQTLTREFSATADEVGTVSNCLGVSYTPALCTIVRVVKPELQITKTGPTSALICDDLTYTYRVTNTGTGVAQGVTVTDDLPEGLTTAEGGKTLSLNVGDLNQGQSKDVTARLRAARTGDFTSRAIARTAGAAGTEARSREVTTAIRQPVLTVNVEGPEFRYVNEPVDYRVTVRNTGDAPAERATLALSAPGGVGRIDNRDLGTIPAGEQRTITVSSRAGRQAGDLRLTATATARCAKEGTDNASVAIRVIPALRLECVDTTDPVRVDGTSSYTITVTNTGSGPESNVTLGATVPAEMQYVGPGRGGATAITANGNKLTFAPVPTLAPGAAATWTVEVKAIRPGDARFGVEMTSGSLTKPVDESESTRVIER